MEKGTQMRFTDAELALITATFKGNENLLKLMRKVFLPEYQPYAPLGQGVDLWMTIRLENLSAQDREVRIIARNELILHVEQQLLQLNSLANMNSETPEEKVIKQKKDSTK